MKTPYGYVTLRYVHDMVTGEFVNVGVVLYAPEARYLGARFTRSYERLNALFRDVDHRHFRKLVRHLDAAFSDLAQEVASGLGLEPAAGVEAVVRRVLPPDDCSLQWSPSGAGLATGEDLPQVLAGLFSRLVEKYTRGSEAARRTDEDIGRNFKASLKAGAARLSEKRVSGRDYHYDFHFAWKNAAWHLYEPVSFDLVDKDSILEKANRWVGRGVALSDAPEKPNLHLLLGEPGRPENRDAFEHACRLLRRMPQEPELVAEADIPAFASRVAAEIAMHPDEET